MFALVSSNSENQKKGIVPKTFELLEIEEG
jgi:hypothetical protein